MSYKEQTVFFVFREVFADTYEVDEMKIQAMRFCLAGSQENFCFVLSFFERDARVRSKLDVWLGTVAVGTERRGLQT